MIHLQVLGRLELRGAEGGALHSVLAQPKRQGLLAYLAVAVPRGYHRRDSLVALLWPDSDEEHARASLSRAVNHLRQTMGQDAIISRGHAELGIDWHRVWCDAAGFEDALERGDTAEAMALYRGDLLPGFHIEEVPEFEQWLERERARLRGRAIHAAKQLSEREEANGQLGAAVEWARRTAALDQLDEAAVRRVMQLLERTADRAGALRTYDEFAARLRSELEAEPARETRAVMEAIRDRPEGAMALAVRPSPPVPVPAYTPAPQAREIVAEARPETRPRSRMLAVAAVAALAVIGIAGWLVANRESSAATQSASVAMLPFVVQGTTGDGGRLGQDMVTLLAERLGHSGVLHPINARAVRSVAPAGGVPMHSRGVDSARALVARFKPEFMLLGEIESLGDSIRVNAALFDSVAREPVARASMSGTVNDLARMAAEISWQLVSARPTRRAPLWDRSPVVLTSSAPALKALLSGEAAYNSGHYVEATRHYKEAVEADTAFALAYLHMSRAANWAGDYPMEEFATQRAMDHLDRLSIADQLLAQGWYKYMRGDPVESERLARALLVNVPGSHEALYLLGELRFHWGRTLGWTIPEARSAYERAFMGGPQVGMLVHLARIAAMQGRVTDLDSIVRVAIPMGLDGPQLLELRGLRALASGDRAAWSQVTAAAARLDDAALHSVAWMVAVHGAEYGGAADIVRLLRRRGPADRHAGALWETQLAAAHGRLREIEPIVRGPDLPGTRGLEIRAALALLPHRAVPRETLERLRAEVSAAPRDDAAGSFLPYETILRPRQAFLVALLGLKTGNESEAERLAAELERTPTAANAHERIIVQTIRAEVLRARGKPAEALAALGEPVSPTTFPSPADYHLAHARFLRAELLRELKRWNEALRWYETFPDPAFYDVAYLPAVHAGKGATYEALGDVVSARASYQRAASLLANADADFSLMVGKIRERLAALR